MDKTGALTLSLASGAQLGTPAYSSSYPWTLRFGFENAADVVVIGTLSTPVAPVVCTAPAMASAANTCVPPPAATGYTWNNNIKAWVANIGVLVSGANTLPATCLTIGDDCWKANVANGTVKFVNSGSVMTGLNTRPIVFAFYVVTNRFGNPSYNLLAIYGDSEAESAAASQNLDNGGVNSTISAIKGSTSGALMTGPVAGCAERTFTGSGFGNTVAACPI